MKAARAQILTTCLAMVMVPGGHALAAAPADVAAVRKAFGSPAMLVAAPAAPPVIDGQLDDPAWRAAEPVTLGYVFDGWEPPTQRTTACVLADEKAIYFAVRCQEAHPQQIKAVALDELSIRNRGDTVELFLDPRHNGVFRYYDRFHSYYHVIVSPAGVVFARGGPEYGKWRPAITAKTSKFDGGWMAEVAIPMADLGLRTDTIPDVWGLNVCRQRPELGVALPKAARVQGRARFHPPIRPLDEPEMCRQGEWSAWAPTWDDYSYPDAMPLHHPEYFGHALLEVGKKKTPRPAKVFELIYKSHFDAGDVGPWHVWRAGNPNDTPVLLDEGFRGAGKSLTFAGGGPHTLRLGMPLVDLECVTMIATFRLKQNGRLYYYGRAPDNKQCGAHRHEVFMTRQAAEERAAVESAGYSLFPPLDVYHTHADFLAWKPLGRRWKAPGDWVLMSGYFSEPSIGSVMSPGTDWCILRTRLGLFRRYHGADQGQRIVPRKQVYPGGLTFAPGNSQLLLGDVVIFRGFDIEPPRRVTGLVARHHGDKVTVTWRRAADNTLAGYYRVYVGERLAAETHWLSVTLDAEKSAGPLRVTACDLYGNESAPSEAVAISGK